MKVLLTVILILSFLGCNKKSKKEMKDKASLIEITFDSPFKFVHDPSMEKSDIAASFGEVKILKQKLSANNQALLDLDIKNQRQLLVLAYQKALAALKNKGEGTKISIEIPFAEPKETVKNLLSSEGESLNEKIQFSFESDSLSAGQLKIDNQLTTIEELSALSLPFAKNLNRAFILRMRRIEGQVSRLALMREAKRSSMSVGEYVKQKILTENEVSDDDARKYGLDNNVPESSIDEEMLERLRSIVESKTRNKLTLEHSSKLLKGEKVRVAYKKPGLTVSELDLPEGTPQVGSGPVNITLISNFMCDSCKDVDHKIVSLVKKNSKILKLNYVFNFKPEERSIRSVSEAALCVNKLNDESFWKLHELSQSGEFDGTEKELNEIVDSLGMDMKAFKNCYLGREFKKVVDSHGRAVARMGHFNLPVILVNGKVFESPQYFGDIEKVIGQYSSLYNKAEPGSWWQWLKSFFS